MITYETQLLFSSFPRRLEISEDFDPEALRVTGSPPTRGWRSRDMQFILFYQYVLPILHGFGWVSYV